MSDLTTFVDPLPELRWTMPTRPAPHGFQLLWADDPTFTYPSRTRPSLDGVT